MKRKVYLAGETVLDIIFKNSIAVNSTPGGSMLNTSVSLARSGANVSFITEFANDIPGKIIQDFLIENSIDFDFSNIYDNAKTNLALAFLDTDGNAQYSFYKEKYSNIPEHIPSFSEHDIFIFGSIYSISDERHQFIQSLLYMANKSGAITIYDPNFRNPQVNKVQSKIERIADYLQTVDIVKGSSDDFMSIFGYSDAHEIVEKNSIKNKLIITNSSEDIQFYDNFYGMKKVDKIEPVSTIGAGDNFTAGLVYGIIKSNLSKTDIININGSDLNKLLDYGSQFAKEVCLSVNNYIESSSEFYKSL